MVHWLKRAFLLIILMAIIVGGMVLNQVWQNSHLLPIKKIVVVGAPNPALQADVKRIIEQKLNKNLMAIPLAPIEHALENLSWVDGVKIQRIWPDTLKITISPERPVAHWNKKYWLNNNLDITQAQAFFVTQNEVLPELYGPPHSQIKMMYYYQRMMSLIMPLGLSIVKLECIENNDVIVWLNNGMKIQLGDQHILTRLQRFVKVYPAVFANQKQGMDGDVIDLRYSNGMAVRWGSK